ncbi:GlcG/HbpS family heme-binding protein [Candidatus Leptofilum sp.]|uniref:GlcG/HbpS family heme-binding protein n=1 Tax=Candidatus Leptofilum sp. TaxID=3241576 RepID=UPI003B5CB940
MKMHNWKSKKVLMAALASTAVVLLGLLVLPTLAIPAVLADGESAMQNNDHAVRGLVNQTNLPLNLALAGATAAMEACAADGYLVSVAVVDASGVSQVQLRADGAGPHTLGSSDGKAYTAASLRRATLGLANFVGTRPDLEGLRDMDDRILILGGGLPIEVDGVVVGGIGVGGAPGGDLDEACAQAGIDVILERIANNR